MKWKVLAVDDDLTLLPLYKAFLKFEHDVITAECGHDALELCKAGEYPDLIIIDHNMPVKGRDIPEWDGLETVKYISEYYRREFKRERVDRTPKFIMCSGEGILYLKDLLKDMNEELAENEKIRIDDYLKKPFSFNELLDRIDMLLPKMSSPPPIPPSQVPPSRAPPPNNVGDSYA